MSTEKRLFKEDIHMICFSVESETTIGAAMR